MRTKKIKPIGICDRCREAIKDRHQTAKYCWTCQSISQKEATYASKERKVQRLKAAVK